MLFQLLLVTLPICVAQDRPGSIYKPDRGPVSMIQDKVAMRPGDIVTVIIAESQAVKNEESTDLSRATNLNYKLNLFDVKPNAFTTLPKVDADSTDGFVGSGSYQKTGAFNARLAAVVVDVLPNGNMVLSGRREIHIEDDTKLIEFTGIVRRHDIEADNTVASELVANATVTYRASGPLSEHTKRYGIGGMVHRAIAWIWPF
ncbi:MAG: flagellar basal body L-ring protein FlgH [Planctomycetes bacterium]|nr:flagellar basal body L-ring protein FlgH [Planctomycetota bacterium]